MVLDAFEKGQFVGDVAEPRVGMATANNDRFVRLWQEVDKNKFASNIPSRKDAIESRKKWFPFAKGGNSVNGLETMIQWLIGKMMDLKSKTLKMRKQEEFAHIITIWIIYLVLL